MAESTHNSVPSKYPNCTRSHSFDPKMWACYSAGGTMCFWPTISVIPRAVSAALGYFALLFQACSLLCLFPLLLQAAAAGCPGGCSQCRWVLRGCLAPTAAAGSTAAGATATCATFSCCLPSDRFVWFGLPGLIRIYRSGVVGICLEGSACYCM